MFLTFWQTSLINWIPQITLAQASEWKDFILCMEMPLFALFLLAAFSPWQFQQQFERMDEDEVAKNMKEVLSVKDILADAYHNFMPSYQEYILQRSEEELIQPSTSSTRSSIAESGLPSTTTEDKAQSSLFHSVKSSVRKALAKTPSLSPRRQQSQDQKVKEETEAQEEEEEIDVELTHFSI